tara:strand:+ start:446 stop:664 length:219 start_codon:yes stop_codon:yes gene_type:complete
MYASCIAQAYQNPLAIARYQRGQANQQPQRNRGLRGERLGAVGGGDGVAVRIVQGECVGRDLDERADDDVAV